MLESKDGSQCRGRRFRVPESKNQQQGEDIEDEALEVKALPGAGMKHFLGRVVLGLPAQRLTGRDFTIGIFPDQLAVAEPRRAAVRTVKADKGLSVGVVG